MELSESRGKLVAVGGAEDKEGECAILKEFVRLAKGEKARVVVMTVASDMPRELGAEFRKVFKRLGAGEVIVADVSGREDTQSERAMQALEEATAVFFTGGDQLHITALLGGTEMDRLIKRRHGKGLLLGGTSAGAAMMSNSMPRQSSGSCRGGRLDRPASSRSARVSSASACAGQPRAAAKSSASPSSSARGVAPGPAAIRL